MAEGQRPREGGRLDQQSDGVSLPLNPSFDPHWCARTASSSSATILVILIIGLTAGPAVSL